MPHRPSMLLPCVAAAAALVIAACVNTQPAPADTAQAAASAPAAAPAPVPPPAPGAPATIACPTRGAFAPVPSSYFAQFYEDYILAYVFADEKTGVYVDVGANDPDDTSVTRYFYDRGWRGINIEPIPELVARLKERRPRDVNLGIGISDTVSELTFYRAQSWGLSTFDPAIMRQHQARGMKFEEMKIPVSTLTAVFDKQAIVRQGVTFLNADVEGYEKQVFSGIDFTRYKPRVIMAESTAPMTEVPTHQAWEPILTAAGYVFAMDDGLNRYYVHSSQAALLPRFLEANYCVGRDKVEKHIKLDGFTAVPAPAPPPPAPAGR